VKDSFRKLADTISQRTQDAGSHDTSEIGNMFEVLEEHLDIIAAAHTNGHYNVHHSHPSG
jgi:hypothetical protein